MKLLKKIIKRIKNASIIDCGHYIIKGNGVIHVKKIKYENN